MQASHCIPIVIERHSRSPDLGGIRAPNDGQSSTLLGRREFTPATPAMKKPTQVSAATIQAFRTMTDASNCKASAVTHCEKIRQ